METPNTITRRGTFDAGHRILFQRFKCSNLHGHRYEYELEFACLRMQEIGYAIDFSEIKRIACQWIDENLDHGFIVNPLDRAVLDLLRAQGSRYFAMHMVDREGSCNPTVENIAKEIFFAVGELLDSADLRLARVTVQETRNCIARCAGLATEERAVFRADGAYVAALAEYRRAKGTLEYDARKA